VLIVRWAQAQTQSGSGSGAEQLARWGGECPTRPRKGAWWVASSGWHVWLLLVSAPLQTESLTGGWLHAAKLLGPDVEASFAKCRCHNSMDRHFAAVSSRPNHTAASTKQQQQQQQQLCQHLLGMPRQRGSSPCSPNPCAPALVVRACWRVACRLVPTSSPHSSSSSLAADGNPRTNNSNPVTNIDSATPITRAIASHSGCAPYQVLPDRYFRITRPPTVAYLSTSGVQTQHPQPWCVVLPSQPAPSSLHSRAGIVLTTPAGPESIGHGRWEGRAR
jgi:hypothetical protein